LIDQEVHAAHTVQCRPLPLSQAAPVAATQADVADVADELMNSQPRDSGVLSPQEFEVQKARAMRPPHWLAPHDRDHTWRSIRREATVHRALTAPQPPVSTSCQKWLWSGISGVPCRRTIRV